MTSGVSKMNGTSSDDSAKLKQLQAELQDERQRKEIAEKRASAAERERDELQKRLEEVIQESNSVQEGLKNQIEQLERDLQVQRNEVIRYEQQAEKASSGTASSPLDFKAQKSYE